MAANNGPPGLGNTPSYQVSAVPFARANIDIPESGSAVSTPKEIIFPHVTKFVTIKNDGPTDFRVGFSARGIVKSDQYFTLESGSSYTGDWKLTRIYLMSDTVAAATGSIVAGLTNIGTDRVDRGDGTGTLIPNWSGSAGVG